MEYLQRGLMSHGLDPGGVKPLDASVPRASGEVAGLGPSRNPSSSRMLDLCQLPRPNGVDSEPQKRIPTLSPPIAH